MSNLTPEQRTLGRENANRVLGELRRRDFLKAAAAVPALGAFYFGYERMDKAPVKAAIIGTGDEGCQAMIRYHNRDYLNYIGFCDIRPSQQARAVKEFSDHPQWTPAEAQALKKYDNHKKMLEDPEVEVVVIALPLWLHAPIAIEAMKMGKHVFCEKLMAHSVAECKEMVKVAHDTNRLLAIGHQRHYSVLYDNANYLVQNDHLGEIRHIRALWHRNNARPKMTKDKDGNPIMVVYDKDGSEVPADAPGATDVIAYADSWRRNIDERDRNVDYKEYGYKSLEELVRWRLYSRTGAGLMAELGSHQLDACSIFLGKKHPLAVTGIGGTFFYQDGREVDDHVFVTFEFPGKDWERRRQARQGRPRRRHVLVDQHQLVRQVRRDGVRLAGNDVRRGGEGDPALQGGRPSGRFAADEPDGREERGEQAGDRDQPEHSGSVGRASARRPGHGRSLAWLSRGARALRVLRSPRQHVRLPRRPRSQAALPRRGRAGRRRDCPDEQSRHATEAPDRVRPGLV